MGVPIVPMGIPGVPIARAAQSVSNHKMISPVIKPIKQKKQFISDDDAGIVDENHLQNVDQSANALGL